MITARISDSSIADVAVNDFRTALFIVETRLSDYIDCLCVGRDNTPREEQGFYISRLATAAELAALVQGGAAPHAMQLLIRNENQAFRSDALFTKYGQRARSAFNLFSRSVGELELLPASPRGSRHGPEGLIGEQLGSVTFVMDYIQLNFDGATFNVCCPIVISGPDGDVASGDQQFRNRLCALISKVVTFVSVTNEAVVIALDQSRIKLFFTSGDETPEPLAFINHQGAFTVFGRMED